MQKWMIPLSSQSFGSLLRPPPLDIICYNRLCISDLEARKNRTMSAQQYRALQGFRDILPEEQPYWRFVEQTAAAVAELYGYRRIETPVIEETGVFFKTSGESSDIVEHEMYTFENRRDKEGRGQSLTLRPEGTASVVRAYMEHG